MRWIFLTLLFLNGVMGLWIWQMDSAEGKKKQHKNSPVTTVGSVSRIKLWSEVKRDDVVVEEELELPPPVVPKDICFDITGFNNKKHNDKFLAELSKAGLEFQPLVKEVLVEPDYWAHIPPLKSKQAALSLLKEMKKKNIDSYYISQGDLGNGISLGLFTRKGSAEKLQAEMQKRGYNVAIHEVERTQQEFTVSATVPGEQSSAPSPWHSLVNRYSELNIEEKVCETFAPSD